MPCKRLFSASKQTADDQRALLDSKQFEELQLMKFAWHSKIMDIASSNSDHIDTIDLDLDRYCDMLEYNIREYEFDKNEDEFVIDN